MFDCPGHVERCDPKTVAVVIGIHTPLSDTSAFHTGMAMTLLLDGTTRVQSGKLTYVDLQADDSWAFVYFGADFTPEDFKSRARAKTIEGVVSTVDFSIKPEDIGLLSEMATHMSDGKLSGAFVDKPTHIVVGVAEDSSQLRQARILSELKPGMEIIAWTKNASDAEIIRRTWQELNSERTYFVMANKGE